MKYVMFPRDVPGPAERQSVGGKAAALAAAGDSGVAIPDWFVVTPRAFTDSLTGEQKAGLAAIERGEPGSHALAALQPNAAVVAELEAALSRLGVAGAPLAVRSSAIEEDTAEHSFAGQYGSFLSVPPSEVAETVAAVWRSGFTARAAAYRRERRLGGASAAPAVVIQRMVEADAAGVAFSADPVGGRRGVCVVSAVRGLGDKLVAGKVGGDTFYVNGEEGILRRSLTNEVPSLTDEQVLRVAALARQMENHFGRPQDIEWALEDDRLHLLQSRPITSLAAAEATDATGDTLVLWDNSNIVESYSGVTTPLTFSFARFAYEGVYRQFARIMGVSESKVAEHQHVFRNMLGLIRGRVYYNLLNWYRLLTLFPGFALNRRFMEQMMGVRETLPPNFLARIAPGRPVSGVERLSDALRLTGTVVGMLKNRILLNGKMKLFYARLHEALAEPSPSLSERRLDELAEAYRDLERRLLTRWDAPLINDFSCMIAFGVLGALIAKQFGDEADALRNELLVGQGDIISAEPAKRIREMASLAAGDAELVAILTQRGSNECKAAMGQRPALRALYQTYLAKFGDRCLGELKLESRTLHDDPLPLFRAIGHCAATGKADAGHAPTDQFSADERLAACFRGRPLRFALVKWVAREAKARVRDRENLRFERTRLFGQVRRIFVEMGKRLHGSGLLADPVDVFYLNVEELLGFVEGTATTARLAETAQLRKAEFEAFATAPAPPRFLTRGPVAIGDIVQTEAADGPTTTLADNERQGLGCCPGTVQGLVRIVRDPQASALKDGEILVAEYTDPGWVTLFSRAVGLLVERGSLLSHSAIVAREMGIPAIVSLPGITSWLKDNDRVELNGATGIVRRLDDCEAEQASAGWAKPRLPKRRTSRASATPSESGSWCSP